MPLSMNILCVCISSIKLTYPIVKAGLWIEQLQITEAVLEHFYVDDYLDSFPDLKQAISAVVEVIQLLKSGRFNLTKLVLSNS